MKGECYKCGFEGEMHQVGINLAHVTKDFQVEISNQYLILIQCPECCFNQLMTIITEGQK